MGQYFTMVCKDLKETMHPHDFGVFAKGCELISSKLYGKAVMYVLMWSSSLGNGGDILLYDGTEPMHMGRWFGKRVKIVGEYDKSKDYKASEHYINISKNIISEMCVIDGLLTTSEIEHLIDLYEGDHNKKLRRSLHIAYTYSKKFEEKLS